MAGDSLAAEAPAGAEEAIAPGQPEIALLFILVSLAVGALCRQLLQHTRIPYTVALLLIGIALGALEGDWACLASHLGSAGDLSRVCTLLGLHCGSGPILALGPRPKSTSGALAFESKQGF